MQKINGVYITTEGKLQRYMTKHFFGIMRVHFLIEDREHPDSSVLFKHQIYVTVFGRRIFSAIIRSPTHGFYMSRGKEII